MMQIVPKTFASVPAARDPTHFVRIKRRLGAIAR